MVCWISSLRKLFSWLRAMGFYVVRAAFPWRIPQSQSDRGKDIMMGSGQGVQH